MKIREQTVIDYNFSFLQVLAILIAQNICSADTKADLAKKLCEETFSVILKHDDFEFTNKDVEFIPEVSPETQHKISSKQFIHYVQISKSGMFRQYDYKEDNLKVYNTSTPPNYNLKNVKAPTFIYSGSMDTLTNEEGIKKLKDLLPNVKKYRNYPKFTNFDFIIGQRVSEVLYEKILKALKQN